jgi:Ribosomal protein L11 methyltransferase (PrmA)
VEGVRQVGSNEPELTAALALAAAASGVSVPVRRTPTPAEGWLARTYASFPEQHIGRRFAVRGTHLRGPATPGRITLTLDAGLAFGSGEHGSTRGCLRALERVAYRRPRRRATAASFCAGQRHRAMVGPRGATECDFEPGGKAGAGSACGRLAASRRTQRRSLRPGVRQYPCSPALSDGAVAGRASRAGRHRNSRGVVAQPSEGRRVGPPDLRSRAGNRHPGRPLDHDNIAAQEEGGLGRPPQPHQPK